MEFNKEQFKKNLSGRLRRQYGKDISQANKHDLFDAVSASALEFIMTNWMATRNEYESEMDAEDMSDKTQRLLRGLSVREQDIVCRKFGIGYDREYELDEIADELGYTHERCRQLLKGALTKMKTRAVRIMAE